MLLAMSSFGSAALAQPSTPGSASPRYVDAADLDPGYAARKALRAVNAPSAASVPQQPLGRTSALPSCFEPLDRTSYLALPRGDDTFLGPIQLGFTFSLFGTPYTECFISNNGVISFGTGVREYNSRGFPFGVPMVAPFWADVDTRHPNSGEVWYRQYPDRLVVTWDEVSYYEEPAANTSRTNTFQVVIRKDTGGPTTRPNVTFAYGDMQWTTGIASSGANGFGGNPATVGVNQGGGNNFIGTGRFNQNNATPPQSSYPAGTTVFSGVDWLDNRCVEYDASPSGNLPPTATGFPGGNILTLTQGETVSLGLQFSGPESGQNVTVVPDLRGLCNVSAPVGPGPSPVVNFSVTGAACNLGTHIIRFAATDDGSPVRSDTFNLTVTVLPPNEWTGRVNTNYNLVDNWSANVVPGAGDNVFIPAGVPNFPLLTTGAEATNFTVASGASMTIGAGGELTLSGDLTNNGTFQSPSGFLQTTGSASQTFGGSGSGFILGELLVGSAGVRLAAPLAITRVLTLDGNLATNSQPFTLLSSATSTAMVINNGAAVVQGNATVQRYISPTLNAGTGYRHVSAPVTGMTVAALNRPGFAPVVVNSVYNTQGTTVRPFPTVYGYDQARVTTGGGTGTVDFDRGFFSPDALTDAFVDVKGYTANILPSTTATLPLSFTGTLHNGPYASGALPRGTLPQSGWHLLGNPYPAPLDWDAAFAGATGLDNAVYVFKSTGTYAGSYTSYVNGIGTARYIGVAQGFFVRTSTPGTSAQLNLTNAARLRSYRNPTFNRDAPDPSDLRPQLRLDLESNGQTDATYVYFESGATPSFDQQYDAYKLPGGSPLYLATSTGSSVFSINGLPALTTAGATVPLLTYLPQAGHFTLRVGDVQNFGTAHLQLEDRQTGIWHDLHQQPSLSFSVSRPDEAATRFVLHINQVRILTSSTSAFAADAVSVWPNPAATQLHVSVEGLPATSNRLHVELRNVLGQVVLRREVPARAGRVSATLDIQGLPPGVYMLKGIASTQTFARSVVVQ